MTVCIGGFWLGVTTAIVLPLVFFGAAFLFILFADLFGPYGPPP